jgi:hypothetical protein
LYPALHAGTLILRALRIERLDLFEQDALQFQQVRMVGTDFRSGAEVGYQAAEAICEIGLTHRRRPSIQVNLIEIGCGRQNLVFCAWRRALHAVITKGHIAADGFLYSVFELPAIPRLPRARNAAKAALRARPRPSYWVMSS